MTRALALALALSGCGLRAIDCPPGEVEAAAAAGVDEWPEVAEVVGRLDVICKPTGGVYGGAVPCIAPWFGSTTQRARFVVEADLALSCTAHEIHHAALWVVDGDACAEHDPGCGWTEAGVERVRDAAREVARE